MQEQKPHHIELQDQLNGVPLKRINVRYKGQILSPGLDTNKNGFVRGKSPKAGSHFSKNFLKMSLNATVIEFLFKSLMYKKIKACHHHTFCHLQGKPRTDCISFLDAFL